MSRSYEDLVAELAGEPLAEAPAEDGPGLLDWPAPPEDGEDAPRLPDPVCLLYAPAPAPLHWLAEPLLPSGEPAVIAGEGGSGKTTVLLAVTAAVAGGYPVFGAFATEPDGAPVLLVSEEDGQGTLTNRLEALILGMGWDRARVLRNLHVFALEGVRLDSLAWQLHLQHHGQRLGAKLYAFDPLADLVNGSEARPEDARTVTAFWRQLARDGASVLTAHHLTKPKDGYTDANRVRGAGSWVNASRTVLVASSAAPGEITLAVAKANRVPRREPFTLRLEVETDPANALMWTRARLTAPGEGDAWQVDDRQALTATERRVLEALDQRPPEALSWTRWRDVGAVSDSVLSRAKRRLVELALVRAVPTGTRAGKPTHAYEITDAGRLALIPEAPTSRLPADFQPTSKKSQTSDFPTSTPPIGGGVWKAGRTGEGTSDFQREDA